jgi:hypothetical protein
MRICHAVALASALVCAAIPAAGAQTQGRVPIRYLSYVAANPIAIAVDIASLELETAVAPGITVGGTASYSSLSDERFTSADFVARYYPGEIVLKGFSLGLSGGYLKYSDLRCCNAGGTSSRASLSAPTIGLALDYNWMLGGAQRFIVGTGIGAKRVLAGEGKRNAVGLDRAYGTARFVVGIAF